MPEPRSAKPIFVRVSESERTVLEAAAAREPLATFMRRVALTVARQRAPRAAPRSRPPRVTS